MQPARCQIAQKEARHIPLKVTGDEWLVARGAGKVQLMVRTENGVARGFYDALGYEAQATTVLGRWLERETSEQTE